MVKSYTKVTAGLAKSNGSLPPGVWLKTTCTLGSASAPGPTLGNKHGKTLPFNRSSTPVVIKTIRRLQEFLGHLTRYACD